MTIYKAFADQEEISKTLMMKKYLGYTDKDVQDNYDMLMREKSLVAVGDYFAEQITAENPPVDFKPPIRLKNDVDATEKIIANIPAAEDNAENEPDGESGSDETPDENGEASSEETTPEPAAEASFGL